MIKNMKKNGFSLVEASISLVIIGLVISGGMAVFSPLIQKSQNMKTLENKREIENALYAFILYNKRLPCPASKNFSKATVNNGLENCAEMSSNLNYGVIPWRTLGLSIENSMDGYNGFFSYIVDTKYNKPDSLKCAKDLNWKNLDGTIIIEDGSSSTPPLFARGAFALISHGKNGFGATLISGRTRPFEAATIEEQANITGSDAPKFYSASTSETAKGFDDIVFSRSPSVIMIETGCPTY